MVCSFIRAPDSPMERLSSIDRFSVLSIKSTVINAQMIEIDVQKTITGPFIAHNRAAFFYILLNSHQDLSPTFAGDRQGYRRTVSLSQCKQEFRAGLPTVSRRRAPTTVWLPARSTYNHPVDLDDSR